MITNMNRTFKWWFLCICQPNAQMWWQFAHEQHENVENKVLRRPISWGLRLQESSPHAADDRGRPNKPHKTFSWLFLQIVVGPYWRQEFEARGALFRRLWALSVVAKNGRRLSQGSGRPLTDMKYPSLASIRTPTACRLFLIIARERCNERTTKPPLCYHSDGGKSWAKSLWRWNCFQLFPIHSVASSECRWVASGLFRVAAYWAVRGSLSFSISEDSRHGYSGQWSAVVVPCAIKYMSILPLQV